MGCFRKEKDPYSSFHYGFLSISKLCDFLLCNFLFGCYKEPVRCGSLVFYVLIYIAQEMVGLFVYMELKFRSESYGSC
jgi:hypothetical protein